jgi:hypothetical protein
VAELMLMEKLLTIYTDSVFHIRVACRLG